MLSKRQCIFVVVVLPLLLIPAFIILRIAEPKHDIDTLVLKRLPEDVKHLVRKPSNQPGETKIALLLLFYVHGKHLRSCRDGQLTLGRFRPPKRLTSTSCTYFRQYLTTVPLESAEGETKVCGQTGYRTQDL